LHLLLENIPSAEVSGILFDQEAVIDRAKLKWANDALSHRTTFVAGTIRMPLSAYTTALACLGC
jgi:hypothetical protein